MKRKRLTQSLLISAALHLVAAAILFSKQFSIPSQMLTRMGKTPSFLEEEELAFLKGAQALESALSRFEVPQSTLKKVVAPRFEPSPSLPQMAVASVAPDSSLRSWAPRIEEGEVLPFRADPFSLSVIEPLKEITISPSPPLEYTPTLPLTLAQEAPAAHGFSPQESLVVSPQLSLQEETFQELEMVLAPPRFTGIELPTLSHLDFSLVLPSQASITHMRQSFSFKDYGLPLLYLKEWHEFFEVDVKIFPHEEKGFLFSVNLIPKQDLSDHRLKQNYLFIIDRSSLIDRNLYQGFKKGVSRALCALREGDYFNIVFLDGALTALSEKSLPFTKANQKLAEAFLQKQSHGHHKIDLYSTLSQIIKFAQDPHEAITAILISDGGPRLKHHLQRRKVNEWIEANRDRITLYTAAAGLGNNLTSLKMMGHASRGFLLYSDTHASFPRKLAKLVMDLRYPIGKEMTVSVVSHDSSARIELFPSSSRLPYLFSDHPFVFVGSCDKLSDFTLIVEGKNRNQELSIKKTVSLSKAKTAPRLLMKQWASEKTNALLDQYLREGEITLLEQAEKQFGYDTKNSRR